MLASTRTSIYGQRNPFLYGNKLIKGGQKTTHSSQVLRLHCTKKSKKAKKRKKTSQLFAMVWMSTYYFWWAR
jgi:hypothetical protein